MFSIRRYRPHLIKRERDVITAARIIKSVCGLLNSIRVGAVVGRAERDYALIVHIEKLPIQLRCERAGATTNSGLLEEAGKTLANFVLLFEQQIKFVVGTDRFPAVIVWRLRCGPAGSKTFR